ncbi:MAG: PAS domain S-box protein, partial [Spirochaetaceae bacterium]
MHTILLVEDEPIIALTERRILEARGYAVTTAQNGAEAIELARTHEDLDLVLMDIDLGSGPDGVETAEALLSFRQLPVVFLTSHTGQDIVERVQAVSSYGYVVKSSGEFVLLESIRMALQLFEAHTGLARRKEFIEAVLDVLPVGIATTDLQSGTSDYLNRAFEQIYGWPFEVIADVDRFFEAVYPDPEYRAQIRSKVMDDIATGDPGKMIWDNVRITTRDGEERIIRAQNIPIPGQKRMISTVMDRTEQKRTLYALQASERKYRSMLESLQEGIIQINAEGIITFVNTPMADMIGYSVDEISGKTLPDFMDDEGKQLITEAIERRRTGVAEQMDAHFLHRDGHRVYVMVGTAPL